jgi:hypothetical protein
MVRRQGTYLARTSMLRRRLAGWVGVIEMDSLLEIRGIDSDHYDKY